MLYDTIYDFFLDNIFTNVQIGGISTTLGLSYNEWFSHTCTIVLMVLGVVFLVLVVRWIFKLFAGLIF